MANASQMLAREKDIQEALGKGTPVKTFCEELALKYNVQSRSIYNQYLQLVSDIKKSVLEGREDLRSQLMARNDYIYTESIKSKNYKTALEANTAQAKLAGLADKQEQQAQKPTIITVKERDPGLALVKDIAVNDKE